mmetsp:Transcript_43629/g.141604  ORF Transcript_43629/g.141604 Transcript_43629/m.141604 type:complete len:405 (-) Transcript_43629:821-2035(-)
MYFSNSDSTAFATAPTAMSASSCTVEFLEPKTWRKSCMRRSAISRSSWPSFCVTTCSVPHSSPCSSFCASRSSLETICIAKDCSSRPAMTGSSWAMWALVSSAALVSVVFSASYAETRRFRSPASGRSVQASSARARSTKRGESTFVGLLRVSSQCSARLCSAEHTLAATRGSSLSPASSTPSASGGSPGCSARVICCHCSAVIARMWCSHTRPMVHAAVSLTWTDASRISRIIRLSASAMYGCSAFGDGPSRMEPKASVAASRRRQSVAVMWRSMKGVTYCTTSSSTTCATRARQVAAAIATFHVSSSSSSSSCFVRPSSSSGVRKAAAPRTKFWHGREGGRGGCSCSASCASSISSSSSSQMVDQNSMACWPTSSSAGSCVAFSIACSVSVYSACMYGASLS